MWNGPMFCCNKYNCSQITPPATHPTKQQPHHEAQLKAKLVCVCVCVSVYACVCVHARVCVCVCVHGVVCVHT